MPAEISPACGCRGACASAVDPTPRLMTHIVPRMKRFRIRADPNKDRSSRARKAAGLLRGSLRAGQRPGGERLLGARKAHLWSQPLPQRTPNHAGERCTRLRRREECAARSAEVTLPLWVV